MYVVESPNKSFHNLGGESIPNNLPDSLLMFPSMSVGLSKLFHSKLNRVNRKARSLMSTHVTFGLPVDDRTARLKAWIPDPHPISTMLSFSWTCWRHDQWSISALRGKEERNKTKNKKISAQVPVSHN